MNKTSRRAFSLVEMLVVIVIVAMLSVLMAPAVTSIMRGTALTSGADKVVAVFSLARQKALTKNHAVEVRFYQYADSGTPGETTAASGKYRAIQVFDIDDNGKATPLGKCESMPTSIIMDSGVTLSTLIGSVTNKTWPSTNDTQISIPRAGTSYNCRAFRFTAEGSAALLKTNQWFVTLHNVHDGDNLAVPPNNYMTIQIDPANGALKSWQP